MIYEFYIPAFPLNLFIESFVYYRDFNPVHSLDRFLPDGNVNVVIDLTDYPKYIYDNNSLKEIQACRNVWFSGIRNHYITIPSGKDSEMFIINFHKGKAYPFVQMPMHELTDCVVDGDLVLTNEILNMREILLSQPAIPDKFRAAERFLMKQYGRKLEENPFVTFAINKILDNPNRLTIESISTKVGYSQKHLIDLFKEHVGVTPKTFLRITRFQRAILELETGNYTGMASAALDSGYFDQAHFIHDFKNFSGFTPRQYLLLKNSQLNYVPIL
jgi:AraC-like DNA-binding protein